MVDELDVGWILDPGSWILLFFELITNENEKHPILFPARFGTADGESSSKDWSEWSNVCAFAQLGLSLA